jgi:hypothetical protein
MTLPASVRLNVNIPFPSLVIANGPVTITKSNGIWTAGFNISNLTAVPNGTLASNLEVLVWNTTTQTFQQTTASLLPTQNIFTGTSAPASAGGQTAIMGTLGASPTLTNTGQTNLFNTLVNGAILQGDGSTYDVTLVNKNGGSALANPTGTSNLQYFGSLLGNGSGSQIGFMTGTGAGGAVTQITSRTTAVTLATITGAITLFSAAGSATAATFTVNNTMVAATDIIHVSQKSGTNLYNTLVTAVAANSFNITFFTTGGVATDAPVFNFVVIKGSAS